MNKKLKFDLLTEEEKKKIVNNEDFFALIFLAKVLPRLQNFMKNGSQKKIIKRA